MPENESLVRFEFGSAADLRAKYSLGAESRPIVSLDPGRVPLALRHLVPVAEAFGVADDLMRTDLREKLPAGVVEWLRQHLEELDDDLDRWLAGPEADAEEPTEEYVAFTALRMLADGC